MDRLPQALLKLVSWPPRGALKQSAVVGADEGRIRAICLAGPPPDQLRSADERADRADDLPHSRRPPGSHVDRSGHVASADRPHGPGDVANVPIVTNLGTERHRSR